VGIFVGTRLAFCFSETIFGKRLGSHAQVDGICGPVLGFHAHKDGYNIIINY
jgi:hypothetical protein